MASFIQKQTVGKAFFKFFLLFLLLAPISFSILNTFTESRITIEFTAAYASGPSGPGNAGQAAIDAANAAAGTTDADDSNWIVEKLIGFIGQTILSLSSAVTWFGGKLFDTAITDLVLEMGTKVRASGFEKTLHDTWSIIRDLCNLAFIFGFIFVGIRTIIDPDSADTKKFLSRIIIGALLINFSLYITEVVIDFSNFTAVKIYDAIVPAGNTISEAIGTHLGLSGFFNVTSADALAKITTAGHFWYYFMASIFLLVTGFALAAAGILLIVRYVELILVMVFSPVLFGATVFPQTKQFADKIWHKLFSSAFFAPIFLLLLYISLKLVEGLSISNNGENISNAITNDVDSFGIILNFCIIIFFIITSIALASKLGVAGGNLAISTGNKLRGTVQGAMGASTLGLGARLGRASAGRWAHNISEREGLKDAASLGGIRGFAARQALKSSRAVGDASFDARNINGAGKAMGIGEGRKGGYTTAKKEVQEKEEKFARSLGEIGDSDVRVEGRKKEMQGKERELRALEEHLKAIPNDGTPANILARQNKREEIEAKKKDIEDSKIKYESEKQRRIIGSTYSEPEEKIDQAKKQNFEVDIQNKKDDIKALWEGGTLKDGTLIATKYADPTMSETNRKLRRHQLKKHKDELIKLQKELYEHLTKTQADRGYAGVLENSSLFTAWPAGRMVKHEEAAGAGIRKTSEKGLPKKKED